MEQQQPVKIADAALRVPCTKDTFLKVWFDLLRPVHKLTAKETEVAVCLVRNWFKLRNTVKDDKQLNMILFSSDYKAEMCKEIGMSSQHMRKVMIKLRQREVIKDGKLNYRFIPTATDGKPLRLMFIITTEDAKVPGTDTQ